MAVSLLNAWADTGATSAAAAGSFTVGAGDDRFLAYVIHAAGSTDTISAVAYGGVAMTQRVAVTSAGGFPAKVKIWTLNEAGIAAASGTGFSVTGSTNGRFRATAVALQDVDQTSPVVDSGSGVESGGNPANVALTAEAGGYALAGVILDANGGNITFNDPVEALDIQSTPPGFVYGTGGEVTSGTTFTVQTTTSSSTAQQCQAGLTVRQVAAGTARATGAAVSGGSANAASSVPATLGLNSGLRRLHVSLTSTPPLDGSTPDATFTTVQAALDDAEAGDVISVGAGHYFETPSVSGLAGTALNPIWLVAEERGEVTISNYWQEVYEGTQAWVDQGSGVYAASHADAYSGSFQGSFLFRYQSRSDLEATNLVVPSILGGNNTITKPAYGFAEESGTFFLKLPGGADPNGQRVKITDDFQQVVLTFTNCDHVIVDGINVEGAGDIQAISFDAASAAPTIRNCKVDHSRFLGRVSSDFLIEWNEYTYDGFAAWMRELIALDGLGNAGIFDINKNYNVSSGNTFYEGGIITGTTSTDETGEIRFNWIHGVFEGMRAGEHDDVDIHDNVIEDCGDNWIEFESFRGSDASADIRFFHNLCLNAHDAGLSHQPGNDFQGPHYIWGNVFLNDDLTLAAPRFMIKTINAATNSNDPLIAYWNNYFKARRGTTLFSSPSGQSAIWGESFSSDDAEEIDRFSNNVAIYEDDLDDAGQPNPATIETNILAAPSDSTAFQSGGGSRVANEAALVLGSNRQPLGGSPLIGAGTAMPGGFPTVAGTSDDDVGPFASGFDPGTDWPRVRAQAFALSPPAGFIALADIEGTSTAAAISAAVPSATAAITAASNAVAEGEADLDLLTAFARATGAAVAGGAAEGTFLQFGRATGSAIGGGSANASPFVGARATGAAVSGGSANAAIPPSIIPSLPLEDSFLDRQSPVFLIDLFFDGGQVNIWTRPVEGVFAFKTYLPLAGIDSGLTIRNSLDANTLEASLQLSGQSPELLAIALTENYRNRRADVYLANLDENMEIAAIENILIGRIVNMPVSDTAENSTVSIVIDSLFRDLSRPEVNRLTKSDLATRSPGDSFLDFTQTARVIEPGFGQ